MKKILGLLLGLFIVQAGFSHYKAKYHVIVDTDGGVDDFRAICMLLASPDIEVIGITTTDGVLDPVKAAFKVSSLLQRFGHQGIPVGIGDDGPGKSDLPAGAFEMAEKLSWGEESTVNPVSITGAVELIMTSLDLEEMPVDILALGPLTNIAKALQVHPDLKEKVRKITWYSEGMTKGGLNYEMDPDAANMVSQAEFRMDYIHSGGSRISDLQDFILALDTVKSDYAKAIQNMYEMEDIALQDHHMASFVGDDCIPLFLVHPEYFRVMPLQDEPERAVIRADGSQGLQLAMLSILDSDKEDKSIIFKSFPVYPELFEEDVATISGQVIEKYGLKEWKIVVLTNEFHEHLGIYSIIGAKMGLRAREYYHIGIDEFTIESLAGSNPPVSCLNDGLQSSTGATLGHGTIVVSDDNPSPGARFTFKNSTIEIRLKEEIRNQIMQDVQTGVQRHGLNSPEYWDYIRKLALQYWLDLNRKEIFVIKPSPA